MKRPILFAIGVALAPALLAAEVRIDIDVPSIETSDYRRPYMAVWIERPDNTAAANLSVWYDVKMRNNEGMKWLKDMRLWWRRIGREVAMPVDGITSATRPPGSHRLEYVNGERPLGDLPAGDYRLVVEASREHGGREVLNLPFQWPPRAPDRITAEGKHELGIVTLELTP